MAPSSIRNVLVIGAGGNVGRSTVKALLDEECFQVTGLTRESSAAVLPPGVRHVRSDFSEASLREAFRGQDAVVSTVPPDALAAERAVVDAAIAAGVKVFVPSEFGVDTSDRSGLKYLPLLKGKMEALDYVKSKQDKIAWTAVITGAIFDWGLDIPGFGGFNVPAAAATIYDGGGIRYEATTLDQVGRAIAKSLKAPELTRNQYVYVNSFTVTQSEVLRALEKATGKTFAVSEGTVEELWQTGTAQQKEGQAPGVLSVIAATVYGKGGLTNFSATKGLWNEKLGLPQEDLDQFVKEYVAGKQ